MIESRGAELPGAGARPSLPFKLFAILLAAAMAFGLPFLADHLALLAGGWSSGVPQRDDQLLAYLYLQHAAQAVLALVAIGVLGALTSVDFGLRLPARKGQVLAAVAVCLAICAVFTFAAYAPNIVSRTLPIPPHPLTARSIAGWSVFEGVFVGPTEEVLFRSLIVGYLAVALPGSVRFGQIDISAAAFIGAILFGLAHLPGNWDRPWWQSLFQVTYAFALGLAYGYWFQKSRSLVVPALAHNATDLAATLAGIGLSALRL